jgi:hypothetical protein
MTKIICNTIGCKYNKDKICTRDEIHFTKPDCEGYEPKS